MSENIFAGAFATGLDKILNFGYPRMDIMGLSRKETMEYCKDYSSDLIPYIKIAEKYDKVFLYMPTYRDDDPNYFQKANVDFRMLSMELSKINGVFFLKLHPLTKNNCIDDYKNIIQISNDIDIYPFLIYTDYLVTDYSSIFFDYLILNREIIFVPYDYDNYISHRELYFNYDEITPGKKYYSFTEFISNICKVDEIDYSESRKRVKNLMIKNYNYNACEKTYNYIKSKYQ